MRKLFIPAAAVATLCAATGASSFEHHVNLSATVPLICSFGTPTPTGDFSNVSSASSNLKVNMTGDHIEDQNAKLTFANVSCNGDSTHIALERTGLVGSLEMLHPPAGFKNAIDYDVKLSWGINVNFLDLPAGTAGNETNVNATNGDFVVGIHVPQDLSQFIADTYTDTLILTVAPTS